MKAAPLFPRLPVLRVLGKPLFLRLLLLLAVIEAIFLAESFTTLMEHALRTQGRALDVLHLLSFKLPEILDLALALSLLIATYFATQDARNRGELIILATAGVAWTRVIAAVLLIGTLGGVISFLNAGLLHPMARYGERLALAELQKNHLLSRMQNGTTQTAVQTLNDTTFVALPAQDPAAQAGGQLLVFQPQETPGNWRIAQSQHWQITAQPPSDTHKISVKNLTVITGHDPTPTEPAPTLNRFTTETASFAFSMSDALPPADTRRSAAERLLNLTGDEPARLTRLITRALMVPMAGLLALAALVVAPRGVLRMISLPLAALLMLCVDVASRAAITPLSASLSAPLLIALASVLYLGPPLLVLGLRGEALMTPDRSRT
ncbi:LptF/LptG family permease [Shimia sp. R11_0]|uniref:LptF/LptG family permease n=1 Tax=Shimia sp. R11_0 TaxID=2821096 RepID=UPI001AD95F3B|nr:LptF/LptG family permease [Shimia sp. R11_0]MBO9476380.1 LptF/LptG family permease [Shimia sp. R11_0]